MYDAFISYNQKADKPIALALRTVIQSVGNPWWKVRSLNVFLDSTSLSAAPGLWPAIEAKLAQSRWLILLASREASKSPWVDAEVGWWLRAPGKGTAQLLIAVTDGDLRWDRTAGDFAADANLPLPPSLSKKFVEEPLWVDLRKYRSSANKANKNDAEFLALAIDLAATVRGTPKENLYSVELRRQRQNLAWAYGAVGALTALGILAGSAAWIAKGQRDRAERALDQVIASANGLVFDLSHRFIDNVDVPQTFVIDVLEEARRPMDALADEARARPQLALSRGIALNELSAAYLTQEQSQKAIQTAKTAISIFDEQVALYVNWSDWQVGRVSAYQQLGKALLESDDRTGALTAFENSRSIADELLTKMPDQPALLQGLATAHQHLGDMLLSDGNLSGAEFHYKENLVLRQRLTALARPPDFAEREIAIAKARMADLDMKRGRFREAIETYRTSLDTLQRLAVSYPSSGQLRRDISVFYQMLGNAALAIHELDDALAWFERDVTAAKALAERDPQRILWQRDLLSSIDRIASLEAIKGRPHDAIRSYQQALKIAKETIARDPNRPSWQRDQAAILENLGQLYVANNDTLHALEAYQQALDIRDGLANSTVSNPRWQRERLVSLRHAIELQLRLGRALDALATALRYVAAARMMPHQAADRNERIARALGTLTWCALLANDLAIALSAGREAVGLSGDNPELAWIKLNLAHALLFSGDRAAAEAIYLSGFQLSGQHADMWRASIKKDFETFKSNNLGNGPIQEIERALWSK